MNTTTRWAARLGVVAAVSLLSLTGGVAVASATPDTTGPTVRERTENAVGVPAWVVVADGATPNGVIDSSPGGCTVTVNGEKKHGQWNGSSWCCLNKGTTSENCYNCDYHTCRNGWNVVGPGIGAAEFESM